MYTVRETPHARRSDAIYHAAALAIVDPGAGVPVWNARHRAVAIVRHQDDSGSTTVHTLDRDGREQPGEPVNLPPMDTGQIQALHDIVTRYGDA